MKQSHYEQIGHLMLFTSRHFPRNSFITNCLIRRNVQVINCTQDRPSTCNVIFRSFCATIVAVRINITYSECVFVALDIQHAMGVYCIVICGLYASTIFFHIIS